MGRLDGLCTAIAVEVDVDHGRMNPRAAWEGMYEKKPHRGFIAQVGLARPRGYGVKPM